MTTEKEGAQKIARDYFLIYEVQIDNPAPACNQRLLFAALEAAYMVGMHAEPDGLTMARAIAMAP